MAVILKPNENEDWPLSERLSLSVNARANDGDIVVPSEAFVFRKNSAPNADDGHLYARGTVWGAIKSDDNRWNFEVALSEYPSRPLLVQNLDTDVIDQSDDVIREIAEVRRVSWTRFFAISGAAHAHLEHTFFGA